jgi:hypothetical protein
MASTHSRTATPLHRSTDAPVHSAHTHRYTPHRCTGNPKGGCVPCTKREGRTPRRPAAPPAKRPGSAPAENLTYLTAGRTPRRWHNPRQ